MCLCRGGPGTRSDFHTDFLDWTGWNILLRGEKLWRWWLRTPENDLVFAPVQIPRCTEVHPQGLAAGWESRADVYAEVEGTPLPASPHRFIPRPSPEQTVIPLPPPDYEVVQHAGEMVVFPGNFWHQVYHYTDTVALAAQYCNDRILPRCLSHVLEWCGVSPERTRNLLMKLEQEPPDVCIEELLRLALAVRPLSSPLDKEKFINSFQMRWHLKGDIQMTGSAKDACRCGRSAACFISPSALLVHPRKAWKHRRRR